MERENNFCKKMKKKIIFCVTHLKGNKISPDKKGKAWTNKY